MRIGLLTASVIFSAALATAQNAVLAVPARTAKSAHVRERVLNSNRERMCWEATQSSSMAEMQHRADPAEHHSIHIDSSKQPALDSPKIRREWLTPSTEPLSF